MRWAVHPGQGAEPTHAPAMVQGASWNYVKLTVYPTVVIKMLMQACEERFADLTATERKIGMEAICIHFNTAVEALELPMRLMMTMAGDRP